jgi:dipeptidase
MCDTLVALPSATATGTTLFAKNSDRERNEAQGLEMWPSVAHDQGEPLKLTYITVPQVARTHGCLLSRPFWMWGAEMGANEHGVVIGNEAVHSVVPPSETPALTGMDLVRLGLERGAAAAESVDIMIALLERHGQGGDCGHLEPFFYHNSFIVADPREAFVLETVGCWWAVERIDGARAISNVLGTGPDAASSLEVLDWARSQGLVDDRGRFAFGEALMDPERDKTTRGVERCARASGRLTSRTGEIGLADMLSILRDHGADAEGDRDWTPATLVGRTICMHAGHGDRRSQTVASMVSDLRPDGGVHWVTGSSAPCLSLFKPVTFASGLPDQGPRPTDRYDPSARWWRSEAGRRSALRRYPDAIADFAPRRDPLERAFRDRIDSVLAEDRGDAALSAAIDACWREADGLEDEWVRTWSDPCTRETSNYHRSWQALGARAGVTA